MDELTERDRAIAAQLIEVIAERQPTAGCGEAVLRALERAGFEIVRRPKP